MKQATVAIGGGTGLLVRRPTAVLFDPAGSDSGIVEAFANAVEDAAAIAAVKALAVERGFDVPTFAIVSWGNPIALTAFGAIQIRSSGRTAPMISGAGSQTWVEHLIANDGEPLEASCGVDVDDITDVQSGLVRCGGFRVALAGEAQNPEARPSDVRPPADPPAAQALSAQPLPAQPLADEPVTDPPLPDQPPNAQPSAHEQLADNDWSDTTDFGPDEVAAVLQASAPPAASIAEAPPAAAPAPDPFHPGMESLRPPPPTDDGLEPEPPIAATTSANGGLVETAMCVRGHANPPRSAACFVCGSPIGTDPDWALIEQPVVGRLVFPQGHTVPVDRQIHLGRLAVEDETVLAVTINHDNVSRSHAEIRVEGWAVLLTDLDSRNGTWICPKEDPAPVRLDAGVPHYLEHDTIVLLGGPDVSFIYEIEMD